MIGSGIFGISAIIMDLLFQFLRGLVDAVVFGLALWFRFDKKKTMKILGAVSQAENEEDRDKRISVLGMEKNKVEKVINKSKKLAK